MLVRWFAFPILVIASEPRSVLPACPSLLQRHKRVSRYEPVQNQSNRTSYQLVRLENESLFSATVRAMDDFSSSLTSECSNLYGEGMVQEFELDAHNMCEGGTVRNDIAERGVGSIVCRERVPFDIQRYSCLMRNVKISTSGTSAQGCTLTSWAKQATFGNSELLAFMGERTPKNFTPPIALDEDSRGSCTSMRGRAIFQISWDMTNFYEWYGDWVTLWETLALLEWDPATVDLFLVTPPSNRPLAKLPPFDEAWDKAFSGRVHVGTFTELFHKGICFSEIATTPHGGLSTTTFHDGRAGSVNCSSPTVRASALYLAALFPYNSGTAPTAMKQATLLMRPANSPRSFVNDSAAEISMRAALPSDWSLRLYRPDLVPTLAEQLWTASQTDVLVGVHGAGMMHVLFMPSHASVVEIFCYDRNERDHHFRNIFAMAGEPRLQKVSRHYFVQPYSSYCAVDADIVRAAVAAFDQ